MQRIAPKNSIPIAIAIFSFCLTLIATLVLSQYTPSVFDSLQPFTQTLPWIILLTGSLFSILLMALAFTSLAAYNRGRQLKAHEPLSQAKPNQMAKHELELTLNEGQKLQAIGTLAGGIAHDFNNLIYAIRGYAELCCADTPKNSLVNKNLSKIIDACIRGQDLIARILAFSRREAHKISPIPLKETIKSALALLYPTIPTSVALNFYSTQEIIIEANQTDVHQVIINLVTNAVDAMDGEGEISINLIEIQPEDPLLNKYPELPRMPYAKLTLTDNGRGMDEPTLKRIFEPFYTTKEVGKGAGLGLSIIHNIVTQHHGVIHVDSELGKGTTFTLLLPKYIKK